jgi:hypothetical protein
MATPGRKRHRPLAHALVASAARPPPRSLARTDCHRLRPGPALLRRLPHRRSARRTGRPRRLHKLPPSRKLPFGRARFAATRSFSNGPGRRRNSRTGPCRRFRRHPSCRFGIEADVVASAATKPFRPRSPTCNLLSFPITGRTTRSRRVAVAVDFGSAGVPPALLPLNL